MSKLLPVAGTKPAKYLDAWQITSVSCVSCQLKMFPDADLICGEKADLLTAAKELHTNCTVNENSHCIKPLLRITYENVLIDSAIVYPKGN